MNALQKLQHRLTDADVPALIVSDIVNVGCPKRDS